MADLKELQKAVTTLTEKVSREAKSFDKSIANVDTAREQLREIAGVPATPAKQEGTSGPA